MLSLVETLDPSLPLVTWAKAVRKLRCLRHAACSLSSGAAVTILYTRYDAKDTEYYYSDKTHKRFRLTISIQRMKMSIPGRFTATSAELLTDTQPGSPSESHYASLLRNMATVVPLRSGMAAYERYHSCHIAEH